MKKQEKELKKFLLKRGFVVIKAVGFFFRHWNKKK